MWLRNANNTQHISSELAFAFKYDIYIYVFVFNTVKITVTETGYHNIFTCHAVSGIQDISGSSAGFRSYLCGTMNTSSSGTD